MCNVLTTICASLYLRQTTCPSESTMQTLHIHGKSVNADQVRLDRPLFSSQACRGDKQDYGVVADGSQLMDRAPSRTTCTVPTGADFCISYAAEPGHVALRDVVNGTPYVCALCEAMIKHGSGGNRDFQHVLTAMNSRICSYTAPPDGRKQTPQVVNTLRKLLYLTMK